MVVIHPGRVDAAEYDRCLKRCHVGGGADEETNILKKEKKKRPRISRKSSETLLSTDILNELG